MITVIFFASLREALGVHELSVEAPEDGRIDTLISSLAQVHGPFMGEALTAENIRIAINQDLMHGDIAVRDGDEVAFFPPVTGG